MSHRGRLYSAASLLVFLLSSLTSVNAQANDPSTGTLKISVTDVNGASVVGAQVEVSLPGQGAVVAKTDQTGVATVTGLTPGTYTVIVKAKAFRRQTLPDIAVQASQVVPVPLELVFAGEMVNTTVGTTDTGTFVKVMTSASLGPLGMLTNPASSASQMANIDPQLIAASQNFIYPSIIFYIASSPVATVTSDQDTSHARLTETAQKSVTKANQEKDRFPEWLDATFRLIFLDLDGNEIPEACSANSTDRVQVLGQLPQQTIAATQNNSVADVSQAIVDTSGALATFYPGVKDQVSAATSAMNIVFKDLFPPRPVAYQYSYVNGSCEVGWYFRPNKKAGAGTVGAASVLGLQTGVLMLKVPKTVNAIEIKSMTLSAWNKRTSTKNSKLHETDLQTVSILPLPQEEKIDYNGLQNLTIFPALISRDVAKRVLHITDDIEFDKFVTDNKIVSTGKKNAYVTNKSLSQFLAAVAAPATPATGSALGDQSAPE